jgi:dihydroorotate dehydrogenase electron transfer subunit
MPGKLALVGGGVGIAPLYLAAKTLREQGASVDLSLGFSDVALLTEEYDAVCDNLTVDVGGYITDRIDPMGYDAVYTCGPAVMMHILADKCRAAGTPLWVSMENRMACGLGACLVCSCKTAGGNKKVCKDGPVFKAEEMYFDEQAGN